MLDPLVAVIAVGFFVMVATLIYATAYAAWSAKQQAVVRAAANHDEAGQQAIAEMARVNAQIAAAAREAREILEAARQTVAAGTTGDA